MRYRCMSVCEWGGGGVYFCQKYPLFVVVGVLGCFFV